VEGHESKGFAVEYKIPACVFASILTAKLLKGAKRSACIRLELVLLSWRTSLFRQQPWSALNHLRPLVPFCFIIAQ
jgi:hypothetical protein